MLKRHFGCCLRDRPGRGRYPLRGQAQCAVSENSVACQRSRRMALLAL